MIEKLASARAPPVRITTPKVLERQPSTVPDELKDKVKDATFKYVSGLGGISIAVSTTAFVLTPEEEEAFSSSDKISEDLLNASEGYLNVFENDGASNITVKREQFITPNGQEGLKTYGSFNQSLSDGEDRILVEYVLLHFRAKNVRQQIVLIWEKEDTYANDIMDRVIESIELITLTEDDQ